MTETFDKAVEAYETKKYGEAYVLFEEVAQTNTSAMVNLALMHMKGTGCEKNIDIALAWFERAAARDNIKALYNLGTFYEKGMNGGVDNDKALAYYKKAADNGFVDAQLKTGLLYKQNANIAEAMRYLITAAHNNNNQAQSLITYVSNASDESTLNNAFRSLDIAAQRALVENMIATEIRPTLASDNGGIELINYIGGETPQIWLNYLGACSGCHLGSTSTADMLLDHFETMIDKNVVLYLM